METELYAVTGALGYTGKYIARRLVLTGGRVINLTGHPGRENPFGDQVSAVPFNFDKPSELVKSLRGATTLYNTYWVRFEYGSMRYDTAVENVKKLIDAAEEAGVKRVVHISIANASIESDMAYYRGKAELEEYIKASRLSYAIIRPTVLFGKEDILINNIAWFLRRFPFFAMPGSGDYGIQPVYVEDVADMAVRAGQDDQDVAMDAAGPETFTFSEFLRLIAAKTGSRCAIMSFPTSLAFGFSNMAGLMVGDVVLTKEEVRGLEENLLISHEPPLGHTRFSDWLEDNKDTIGREYHSELARHFK